MIKFKSLLDLQKVFPTEQHCIKYLERHRWNGFISSPYDPNSKVYKLANGQYRCKKTKKNFNAKTGTAFANTKLPLLKWFYALHALTSRKKGISSHQLARDIGVTQKTAYYLLEDLRKKGLKQSNFIKGMLKGITEIDETYMGGKNKNRHWDKKVPNSQGRSWNDKTPTLVMIERGGNAIALKVPNVKQETLEPIIRANIEEGSTVNTDEWLAYKDLGKWYRHQVVNHRKKQYADGEAYVNTAESFNNCLKGTIKGTYHNVSKKYLQGYVDEVTFRFNTRKYSEKERFDLALSAIMGKQPTYQQLIN